jgi:Uma2 family endonuclease
MDEFSEPEPDLMLLAMQDDYYASAHPGPDDVLLLIEVSDTTLLYDRNVKLPLYARAGIPEVWIVDLQSGQLEVFTEPSSEGYASSRNFGSGDSVSPAAFDDISLAVDDIIP